MAGLRFFYLNSLPKSSKAPFQLLFLTDFSDSKTHPEATQPGGRHSRRQDACLDD